MRQEAINWLKQSESDLKNAELLFKNKVFDLTAYLSHQSAEKMLKALIIEEERTIPEKTHNLINLANSLKNVSKEITDSLKELTPHYIISRYPDSNLGVPAEIFTENIAEKCLNNAKEVLKWAKTRLK